MQLKIAVGNRKEFVFSLIPEPYLEKKAMTEAIYMKKLRLRHCPWVSSLPRYLVVFMMTINNRENERND